MCQQTTKEEEDSLLANTDEKYAIFKVFQKSLQMLYEDGNVFNMIVRLDSHNVFWQETQKLCCKKTPEGPFTCFSLSRNSGDSHQ